MSTNDLFTRLENWLSSLTFPKEEPLVNAAFRNFHAVLRDLLMVFEAEQPHAVTDHWLRVEKPRQPRTLAEEQRFVGFVGLVTDLTLELTRAGNYISTVGRERIDSQFGLDDAAFTVTFMGERHYRPEYRTSEMSLLYPGLNQFMTARSTREHHHRG
jgi:hypothetical protein